MLHSKTHLFFARFAAACIAFLCVISLFSTVHAQQLKPTVPGDGTVTAPVKSPTVPGNGEVSGSNNCADQKEGVIANPLKFCTLDQLLYAVLKAAIRLGTIILTLALVLVGFKFVAARGNEEKIRSAKTALVWTVIGGLILLGATAIQEVITATVGNLTS